MVDKGSVISNAPTTIAAAGGLITAIISLFTFMSVPAPSIVAFDASPNIISIGESSVLKWSVTGNGATANIEPDIGTVGLSGTREVAPSIITNYTLTAKNKDQEKIASVQIIVREKNESNQVTNDVVGGGIAAKSNILMQPDVKAEPDQKRNVIAEPSNPDESTIFSDSDSQQNAVAQPAKMVARTINPSESRMRQSAIEPTAVKEITAADWGQLNNVSRSENDFASNAPIYAKLGDTRHTPAKHDSVSELTAPKATAPESNVGVTESKAVKVITTADWDQLNQGK